ncbi:MAG: hypothetical protein AAGA48_28890 [Myxococcota bacterium]
MDVHQLVDDDRLRGVQDWDDLAVLGRRNLDRLARFAQATATREWPDATRVERQMWTKQIQALNGLTESPGPVKPLLPRLRIESFGLGQEVAIFVGDTTDIVVGPWVTAEVVEVVKAHRVAWSSHPSRGYYWRVTAHTKIPVLEGRSEISFTTSEPRVLVLNDVAALLHARTEDPRFFNIFVENARRAWHPLWCLETGREGSGEALDLGQALQGWDYGVSTQ